MNHRLKITVAAAALVLPLSPGAAETLREALVRAYNGNPTLTGQRANQRANDENVAIARAAGRPQATISADLTENAVLPVNTIAAPQRQFGGQLTASVPIYQGGLVRNSVRAADTRVDAGRALLRSTEANLFTEVVGAYMDVIRDEAIAGLNTQNVRVLDVNLEASRDRFQVGDLTRTDVAQSEARLALARADLQSAQARLITSRENYIRLVGAPAGVLDEPPALPNLPASPEAAVEVALADNPALLAAQRNADASSYDVRVAQSSRLPRVDGVASGNYFNYLGSVSSGGTGFAVDTSGRSAALGVQVQLPLYQGGRPAAQVRQAQALRSQALEQATETERSVVSQARASYAVWRSSLEVIASSEVAVNANKLSLEGVRAENSVGTRTILDILNAEQELLNSQVTLVTARRDAYVAGFALLAAMGEAEARDLGLDGGTLYDPVVNYSRVRGRLSDWADDPAPRPTAASTAATPSQGAEVKRPLDPLLDSGVDRTRPITAGEGTPNR